MKKALIAFICLVAVNASANGFFWFNTPYSSEVAPSWYWTNTSGLVLNWDSSAQPTPDHSSIGTNTATWPGGANDPTYVTATSSVGPYCAYNGVAQYLVDHKAGFTDCTNLLMGAWFYANGYDSYSGLLYAYDPAASYIGLGMNVYGDRKVRWDIRGNAASTASIIYSGITEKVWTHVAVHWNKGDDTAVMYINGLPVKTNSSVGLTGTEVLAALGDKLKVGWMDFDANRYFKGNIADAYFYQNQLRGTNALSAYAATNALWLFRKDALRRGYMPYDASDWDGIWQNANVVYSFQQSGGIQDTGPIGKHGTNGAAGAAATHVIESSAGSNALAYCSFDSGDHIDVPIIIGSETSVTWATWVYFDNTASDNLNLMGDTARNYITMRHASSNNIQAGWSQGADDVIVRTMGDVVSDTTWYHVAAVWQVNADGKIYVNGAEQDLEININDNITALDSGSWALGIRKSGSGNNLPGDLDDVRVYKIPLSTAQITNYFDATKATYGY